MAQDETCASRWSSRRSASASSKPPPRAPRKPPQELGDVEIIYTGPTDTTAEGQIEVINALIAQNVDAIAISANDPDALVPALQEGDGARHHGDLAGIRAWPRKAAQMHLNPSSNALIGNMIIKLAADHLPDGGDVAMLSATTTSTNQNIWIEEMNKVMGNYPGINVVATVYGDDLADKSYREAQGLMQTYPESEGDHRADHPSASWPPRRP